MKKNKVLLLGWDAADWKIIQSLLDKGLMPTLKKLIGESTVANMLTMSPPLSPMLWTSIATGKRAYHHGILNFVEPDVENQTIRPVYGSSRKVKALWNILSENKLKSNIINWWPTHPAESIDGSMVSNLFYKVTQDEEKKILFPDDGVFPSTIRSELEKLFVAAEEITYPILKTFLPELGIPEEKWNKPLSIIMHNLSSTISNHGAATWLMENKEWDFTAVYFDAIDHFCHSFMKFYPPKQEFIEEEAFNLFKDAIPSIYRFHDMMLDRYLELAGEDCTVIIISDHGFKSDHRRIAQLPKEPSSPAYEHREHGIFLAKGPTIKRDHKIFACSLLDIAPTVLQLFDLPIPHDMEGRVLMEIFNEPKVPIFIDTYENQNKQDEKEIPKSVNPLAEQLAMEQLIELGYVEADLDNQKKLKSVTNESMYNLALTFMEGNKFIEAQDILKQLCKENDETLRYLSAFFNCSLLLKRFDDALFVLKAVEEKNIQGVNRFMLRGNFYIARNRIRLAFDSFDQASKKEPSNSLTYFMKGKCNLMLLRPDEAKLDFLKALSIQDTNPMYYFSLAQCYFRLGEFDECIALCMESVQLNFDNNEVHWLMGRCFFMKKMFVEAAEVLEVYLKLRPRNFRALQLLSIIYMKHLNDETKGLEQLKKMTELRNKTVYIVSGLPRSGTSLMMQMLNAGGVNVLTDDKRVPDINNPKGYFEYEPVKRLGRDKSWLNEANGKVIKVIAQQLFHLPSDRQYKVIFMERQLEEVLQSQQKMMQNTSQPGKESINFNLMIANSFNAAIENVKKLEDLPNFEFQFIPFKALLNRPDEYIHALEDFFDFDMDVKAMKDCIDLDLYRNRLESKIDQ